MFFFFLLFTMTAFAGDFDPLDDIPIIYKGRFRPLHAQLVLEQETNTTFWQQHENTIALPSKAKKGEWLPLAVLDTEPRNISAYPDSLYNTIRTAYLDFKSTPNAHSADALADALLAGYATIADTPYTFAANKQLRYPTLLQLRAEKLYYTVPWIPLCAVAYAVSMLFRPLSLVAFALNTLLLALRCFILQRPPVSSMFETVLFVPWITMGCGLLLAATSRSKVPLTAAAAAGAVLFSILTFSGMPNEMENVQAVLDSQYWLTIHVLMVVGSYGVFALAALLAHLFLIQHFFDDNSPLLPRLTLHTLYIGTMLLVVGTILGGIWAAQSWGRFWDWDPKESWAFISSCLYLLCIHAYRFHLIGPRGLALGTIGGFLAITFTWYGVNYILGTGLHSYGFGSGGTPYYLAFLGAELLFLGGISLFPSRNSLRRKRGSSRI